MIGDIFDQLTYEGAGIVFVPSASFFWLLFVLLVWSPLTAWYLIRHPKYPSFLKRNVIFKTLSFIICSVILFVCSYSIISFILTDLLKPLYSYF